MAGILGFFTKNQAGEIVPIQMDGLEEATEGAATTPPGSSAATQLPPAHADHARFQAELAARDRQIQQLNEQLHAGALAAITTAAKAEADGLVKASLIKSHAHGAWDALATAAGKQKAGLSLEGIDLTASLASLKAGLVPHNLTTEAGADALGVTTLANGSVGSEGQPSSPEKIRRTLASYPDGGAALRAYNLANPK